MKIVFGVIVCIVVVIVTLCLYSILTQKCPSTSSNGYTPSLTCAGANLLNAVANGLNWILSNMWAVLLVPAVFAGMWVLKKMNVSKVDPSDVDGTDTKPDDNGGDDNNDDNNDDDGGGGEGGGGDIHIHIGGE